MNQHLSFQLSRGIGIKILWVALPGFIISCGPSKIDFNTGEELIFLVKIDTLSKDRGKDFLFLEGNTESGVGEEIALDKESGSLQEKIIFNEGVYSTEKDIREDL